MSLISTRIILAHFTLPALVPNAIKFRTRLIFIKFCFHILSPDLSFHYALLFAYINFIYMLGVSRSYWHANRAALTSFVPINLNVPLHIPVCCFVKPLIIIIIIIEDSRVISLQKFPCLSCRGLHYLSMTFLRRISFWRCHQTYEKYANQGRIQDFLKGGVKDPLPLACRCSKITKKRTSMRLFAM